MTGWKNSDPKGLEQFQRFEKLTFVQSNSKLNLKPYDYQYKLIFHSNNNIKYTLVVPKGIVLYLSRDWFLFLFCFEQHGAVVNVADLWKFTPLHEASAKGKFEICRLLLKVGYAIS